VLEATTSAGQRAPGATGVLAACGSGVPSAGSLTSPGRPATLTGAAGEAFSVTGSWIGRSLSAVPAILAAVAAGTVVVGMTGEVTTGLSTTVVLAALGGYRAARTGVTIDVDRHEVVLRTFWRTHRLDATDLLRVDALDRGADGPPGVRFQLRDGREYGPAALAYLADPSAARLADDLRALTEDAAFEVSLTTGSFRRVAG
jgi:hypothetical protein